MTVVDSLDATTLQNLTITCVTTGVSKLSSCAPVAFNNPSSTSMQYNTAAGTAQHCPPDFGQNYDATPAASYPKGTITIHATSSL